MLLHVFTGYVYTFGPSPSVFALVGSIAALAAWPVMAALAWRETSEDCRRRSLTVSCPTCDYDLRGLSECRCPECGEQYTLDSFYAAQLRGLTANAVK